MEMTFISSQSISTATMHLSTVLEETNDFLLPHTDEHTTSRFNGHHCANDQETTEEINEDATKHVTLILKIHACDGNRTTKHEVKYPSIPWARRMHETSKSRG